MVTGSTLYKACLFKNEAELDLLHDLLLELAEKYQWQLEAWVIFANHYHFVGRSKENSGSLGKFLTHLHAASAKKLNIMHKTPGRRVWYQFWDSKITYHASYLARIHYVMNNPVKHKLVHSTSQYQWSSVNWFRQHADKIYLKIIESVNSDNVNIRDNF